MLGELDLVRDGDVDGAADTARRIVELSRQRGDDQTVFPFFAVAAWLLVRCGHDAEAAALADELLARRPANPTGVMPGYWTTYLALTLDRLGRRGGLAALEEPEGSRFLEAARAIDEGRFEKEIVPVEVQNPHVGTLFAVDETPRRETSAEALAGLNPAFLPEGKITAGNSSQICDGAAGV